MRTALPLLLVLGSLPLAAASAQEPPAEDPATRPEVVALHQPGMEGIWLLKGHGQRHVAGVTFSPDGKRLATSGSSDGTIHLWDPAGPKHLRALYLGKLGVHCLAFSPDGQLLAGGLGLRYTSRNIDPDEPRPVVLLDPATYKELGRLEGHVETITALAFSPDGKTLASGSYDGTVRVWDVKARKELHRLRGHPGRVTSVSYSPDGKTLASGGIMRDKDPDTGIRSGMADHVRLWDPATGQLKRKLQGRGSAACLSPDGEDLIYGGLVLDLRKHEDGLLVLGRPYVSVADTTDCRDRRTVNWGGCAGDLSPDGRLLASSYGAHFHYKGLAGTASTPGELPDGTKPDSRLTVWDMATGKQLWADPHEKEICTISAAFSPDNRYIASGTYRGYAFLIDLRAQIAKARPLPERPGAADMNGFWDDLAGEDGRMGRRSIYGLVAAGKDAVALIEGRLPTAPEPAEKDARALIAQLEDRRPATRDQAARDLRRLGDDALPAMRQALKDGPAPDLRKRLEAILAERQARVLSGDDLRAARAVEVLERLGTPEAKEVLKRLAVGAAQAVGTRQAREALRRLGIN